MGNWDNDRETHQDQDVLVETKKKVKKPPMYRVILHNDDYTTMEFVVHVLQTIFHKGLLEAQRIMYSVHLKGIGIAGVYTFEIAEAKVTRVIDEARAQGFPLMCTMEED